MERTRSVFYQTPASQGEAARTVLVVDDDFSIVELLEEFLRSAGYQVLTATNGSDAVAAYVDRRPDAVLMDVRLPGKDGMQALADIRSIDPDGRVAMMTALGQSLVVRQAVEAGAADFVLKPLDREQVLHVIDDLCA